MLYREMEKWRKGDAGGCEVVRGNGSARNLNHSHVTAEPQDVGYYAHLYRSIVLLIRQAHLCSDHPKDFAAISIFQAFKNQDSDY